MSQGAQSVEYTLPPLRSYQAEAIQKLRREIAASKRRIMLSSATGSGKSRIMLEMAMSAARKGKRVVVMCDRIQLVQQMSEHMHAAGVEHGIIQSSNSRAEYLPVVVASIQTVAKRGLPDGTDLLLIDEAHGAAGRIELRNIIERAMKAPKAAVIGFSATPWSRGLAKHYDSLGGPLFESLVTTVALPELIEQGFLVDCDVYAPCDPDLSQVKVTAGDYNERQLGEAMNKTPLIADIVETWVKLAYGLPTVCFATNIAHSEALCAKFRAAGVAAEHISCHTDDDERKEILKRVASGQTKVICNAMLLTTGWDFPACRCMILARPTKSLVTFVQMCGRILRPHDNISVRYRRYMEERDVCRGNEVAAGRQTIEHGSGDCGVAGRGGEATGIPALEPEECRLFHEERTRLSAERQPGEGPKWAGQLPDGGDTREAIQRSQAGGNCLDTESSETAASQSQGRGQAEQSCQQSGVGHKLGEHESCAPAWLVPGSASRRCSREEQAGGMAGAGDKAGPERLSSWAIDRTGEKIRCAQNDDKRDSGWEKLGACFVASDEEEAKHVAHALFRLHVGEESLLVVSGGTETGAAKRITGIEVKRIATILDHSGTCLRLGFPTDDRSDIPMCDGKPKAGASEKRDKPEALPKACPNCHYLKPAKVHKCPACSFEPKKPSNVEVIDGDLMLVKGKKRSAQEAALEKRFGTKQEVYSMLLAYASDHGMKTGFAAHKYRAIFGVWPKGLSEAKKETSLDLQRWIVSERIRWAKTARQGAANASV